MSTKQQTVLVVDDVPENIDVLSGILRSRYKVKAATNGERALAIAGADDPPDLLLLDVMMPGMDGFEVCRRLKENPETEEIPIMFVTALGEVADKVRGFEVGGTDYITKPFEPLEVQARVKSLLDAKAYQDAVKERLAMELQIAREIQRGLLPESLDAVVEGLPLELSAFLEPAREVGGDLYLAFPLEGGRVCAVLGDVSGKGIPAAMFMAVATTLVRTLADRAPSAAALLTELNRELAKQNPRTMFVTIVCAIVDPAAATLDFASGGHNASYLLRQGESPRPIDSTGPLVGVFGELPIGGHTIDLDPGDTFIVFTDGVDEAMNVDDEMFGDDRILDALGELAGVSSRSAVAGLHERVAEFVGDAPPSDDLAILALRFRPED